MPAGVTLFQQENSKIMIGVRNIVHGQMAYSCARMCAENIIGLAMGGCRCTYRNCTSRSDGIIHMFHYPVFDKVRCHQWLTNAHKLEYLNLKVSQLKNRAVCQHHFTEDNFMNFMKDKLIFDAVPTEDGANCDFSKLDETYTEQDESKVFSIPLDDIEKEYLTVDDKKANSSTKYGDFLTNSDLKDLHSAENLTVPNDQISSKRCESVRCLTRKYRSKDTTLLGTLTINQAKSKVNISKLIKYQIEADQNPLKYVLNVSQVPIEFESRRPNDKIHENNYQPVAKGVKDMLDESGLLNDRTMEVIVLDEPKLVNEQPLEVKLLDKPKPPNYNADRRSMCEGKKIRIISEKMISKPLPVFGRLEAVSPTSILTFPNKRLFNKHPMAEIPKVQITNSDTENSLTATSSKDNIPEIEPMNVISSRTDSVPPQEIRNNTLNIISNEVLLNNNTSQKTISDEINKTPDMVLPKSALLRNKIPAIEEKRKFNIKLKDIVEQCLDSLDKPDKTDFVNRKLSHKSKITQSKKEQVGSYHAKDPQLSDVTDYSVAYLEARMKTMEDNLRNKIGENRQKIAEVQQLVVPLFEKKTVHTQTSFSEDVHKRQLLKELSKYVSEETQNALNEECFINKFTRDVAKRSSASKRHKHK